jgi:hypothetical protein
VIRWKRGFHPVFIGESRLSILFQYGRISCQRNESIYSGYPELKQKEDV